MSDEVMRKVREVLETASDQYLGLRQYGMQQEVQEVLRLLDSAQPAPPAAPVSNEELTLGYFGKATTSVFAPPAAPVDTTWPSKEQMSRSLNEARKAAGLPAAPSAEKPVAEGLNGYGCVKPDTDSHVFFYEQDFYVLSRQREDCCSRCEDACA